MTEKKDKVFQKINKITQVLLDNLSLKADFIIKKQDTHYRIDIDTKDAQLLIGFKGQTLSAFEHLLRILSNENKDDEKSNFTLSVDVGGYRAKRLEELIRKTKEIAWRVKQGGKQEILPPMNAAERRAIHQLIGELDGVTGESEGFGRDRRLVVKVKK